MNYDIDPISGNSFTVRLSPVTPEEENLLEQNLDGEAITAFYEHALKFKFDRHIHVASLTPNDDFPYSATVEAFTDNGSI